MFENARSLYDYIQSLPEPMTAEEQALVSYSNMLDDISNALAEYRLDHHLNQSQLADQLHCSQSLISAYENGERNISLEKVCALFAGIGKSVSLKIEDTAQAARPAPRQSPFTCDPFLMNAFAA